MKKQGFSILMVFVFLFSLIGITGVSNKVHAADTNSGGINWMNNTKYWPLGADYAWKDWGSDFSDNGWTDRFTKIKADFDSMASQGVHAVRWWVFCDSWAAPLFSSTDGSGVCTGLPDKWIDHMIEATNYAKSKNMKIYYTFTSFDVAKTNKAFYHGSIIDNLTVRKSFIDNAVTPIVKALGNNEGVMAWDVVNEPEWMISSNDGGNPGEAITGFSLSTVRSFVKDMVDCIHQYAKQPVSVGSASMKWIGGQYNFWSGLNLDFYDFHWYDWATPWFNPLRTSAAALKLDRPVMIGEMMPDTMNSSLKMSHEQVLEGLLKNGYSGYMLWAWTDSNTNCVGKTSPDFDEFVKNHPELPITATSGSYAKGDVNDDGKADITDLFSLRDALLN
ncbi:glycoside hydrolase 5 family protein [Clostridium hydrogenum]|uniref:cellulase family glycosylhydrolase n=1 Tax=Clostridium hydrogenum TaxID=2855764 RepID=UPI001F2D365B|nr:cellulase family glycosylhydrolase [Clostridium hydrogenum]